MVLFQGWVTPALALGNAVVLSDAMAKLLHQGQLCMAANRLIVEAPIYDEFVDSFDNHVANIPDNLVGPIINDDQVGSGTGTSLLTPPQI